MKKYFGLLVLVIAVLSSCTSRSARELMQKPEKVVVISLVHANNGYDHIYKVKRISLGVVDQITHRSMQPYEVGDTILHSF